MKLSEISVAGTSTKLVLTYKKRNPGSATGDYFDSASITAANIKILNTETAATLLASTSMTYDSAIRGYRYVWTFGSALSGVASITVEVTPTRAVGVSATLTPIDSEEFPVANLGNMVWDEATSGHTTAGSFGKLEQDTKIDTAAVVSAVGSDGSVTLHQKFGSFTSAENLKAILGDLSTSKRLGQILGALTGSDNLKAIVGAYTAASTLKDAVDALASNLAVFQADFNSFEVINQNEHDDTQARISQIGASAKAQVAVPDRMLVPDSGTKVYRLWFILRDLDNSPATLTDPDSNIVDVTVENQAGATPAGITLGGSPAGRMTRDSVGQFYLDVTVDSTANPEEQLLFTFDYDDAGVPDAVVDTAILVDEDTQMARIEADVETVLSYIGTPPDPSTAATLFGRHKGTRDQVDAIRSTDVPALNAQVLTRESESDAASRASADLAAHAVTQAALVAMQADIEVRLDAIQGTSWTEAYASLKAIRDAIQTALDILNIPGTGGSTEGPGGSL